MTLHERAMLISVTREMRQILAFSREPNPPKRLEPCKPGDFIAAQVEVEDWLRKITSIIGTEDTDT